MNINTSLKKKVRGQKRKTRKIVDSIALETSVFPPIDLENGYWHMHLPLEQSFINSEKLPDKIKRLCMQTIIDATEKLIAKKPKLNEKIRVVAFINLPDIWYSEIIIFFGEKHYKEYFNRNNKYQEWIPLEEKRSIVKERSLRIPDTFRVKGYREILNNDDSRYENELWYLGET